MSEKGASAATPGASVAGPLAGLRVLELGQLIADPFAGRMMADFGADVIKIEPPIPIATGPVSARSPSRWMACAT